MTQQRLHPHPSKWLLNCWNCGKSLSSGTLSFSQHEAPWEMPASWGALIQWSGLWREHLHIRQVTHRLRGTAEVMRLVDKRVYLLGPSCHSTKGFQRKGEKQSSRLCAGQGAQHQSLFSSPPFLKHHNGFPTAWGWLLEFFLDRQIIFPEVRTHSNFPALC